MMSKSYLTLKINNPSKQTHPCEAGLFLWCNVSEHLKERTYAEELDLCEKMLAVGLWVRNYERLPFDMLKYSR